MKEMKYTVVHSFNGTTCSHLKTTGKILCIEIERFSRLMLLKPDAKQCVQYLTIYAKKGEMNKYCS